MDDDAQLAAFEARLLDVLHEQTSIERVLHILNTDPAFEPYRDYIATFEPRMVEVAALLTKKWGDRDDHPTIEHG